MAAGAALAILATGSSGVAASAPGVVEAHAPRHVVPNPATGPGTGPSPFFNRAAPVRQAWAASNWSGYAVAATTYSQVKGTWNVPFVVRPKKRQLKKHFFSADWVGIDGFNNSSLIQAGTEEDWIGGHPSYFAWWEVLPQPEMDMIPVNPNDRITVTINKVSGSDWSILLRDNGQTLISQSVTNYSGPGNSAEWIHEAVSFGGRVSTLPVDTLVTFDNTLVNNANPNLKPSDAGTMIQGRHKRVSTPSVPDADADGFSVAYGAAAPSPPPS
jgi:Peptidase A4 family